jgi:hypothetical protein
VISSIINSDPESYSNIDITLRSSQRFGDLNQQKPPNILVWGLEFLKIVTGVNHGNETKSLQEGQHPSLKNEVYMKGLVISYLPNLTTTKIY